MSRQQWAETRGDRSGQEFTDQQWSEHEKLVEKSDDPEAKDFVRAVELFRQGLKLARSGGDLELAANQITSAFLLNNNRSVALTLNKIDSLANKFLILDSDLVIPLMKANVNRYSCGVLKIMAAQSCLNKHQSLIANAMTATEQLLDAIADDPSIENPDRNILGGCLTRTNLLYQRSLLHRAMGNLKKAIKDLTNALKIDEFFTKARFSRAYLWSGNNLKDDRTIHIEFTRVASEFHRDNIEIEEVYAWLGITTLTLNDPSIGSVEDAITHFDKCIKATIRKDELYGPQRRIDQLPLCVQQAHALFQQLPTAEGNQGNLHGIIQGMRGISVDEDEEEIRKNKYMCVKCGAYRKPDGGMVMQCIRCKSVSYCSAECQKAVSSHRCPFYFCYFVD